MLPITKSIPKELLPVGNKPVLQYIVEGVVSAGIEDIVMITSQGKFAIEDYFDKNYELEEILKQKGKLEFLDAINKPKFLANMCFVRQKQQLGFPHAVAEVRPWVSEDFFLLSVGDALFHPKIFQEMVQLHKQTGNAVIALQEIPKEEVHKYGVAEIHDGKITRMIEKPKVGETDSNLIMIGTYILPRSFFACADTVPMDLEKGEVTLPDVLKEIIKTQPIVPYVTKQPFWDTGTPEKRLQCCNELAEKNFVLE